MNLTIPSATDVASWLAPMSPTQVQSLAELSGVPFHTLLKIRSGETKDPRIETVRQIAPHITAACAV